tara:strand:+ start:2042 stop:2512 length:471 start_codon:yes stop_codon:yes gene_type:complete
MNTTAFIEKTRSAARDTARELRHRYVGTGHLLLALLKTGELNGYFPNEEPPVEKVTTWINTTFDSGDKNGNEYTVTTTSVNPTIEKIIKFAKITAKDQPVNGAHILYGILNTSTCLGRAALEASGYSTAQLRQQIRPYEDKSPQPLKQTESVQITS